MTYVNPNDDYETRVTMLFIDVMHIVDTRIKLARMEEDLRKGIERANVDPRILAALDNEYERSREEPEYKMRSVAWIREDIRRVDAGEETQYWDGVNIQTSNAG